MGEYGKMKTARDRDQRSGDRDRNATRAHFSHQQLDVYRVALEYVAFVYEFADDLSGKHRHARDQLLRASQSIPLNIAEGNGKLTEADRIRYFGIARSSALECAAIQDVLRVGKALDALEGEKGEKLLVRIVSMLTKMTERRWAIREGSREYGEVDHVHDHRCADHDHDENE